MRRSILTSSICSGLARGEHARSVATAACAAVNPEGVALAACAFSLPTPGAGNEITIQLTPAGEFSPSDGREMPVSAWRINGAIAQRVIAAFAARKNPAVLDYEHQTLLKEDNGRPAPAAGWIRSLAWREGQGLFAVVELTARAKQFVADGEYKFISPVFSFDPKSGDITAVLMAALTNTPAIDGMEQVQLRAAATFGLQSQQEKSPMNKLLIAICTVLALGTDTTEDQAVAAMNALKPQLDELTGLRKALGVADKGDAVAACTALKTKADAAGVPDPAKFVPVEAVNDIRTQLAALSAERTADKVDVVVKAALADGRLLPALESWARDLGKKDFAALTTYITGAQPIAALVASQTNGKEPPDEANNPHKLTADELAVCTATGVTPEAFAKSKGKKAA